MKIVRLMFVFPALAVMACSAQKKYDGDTLNSFVDKNSVFEITSKQRLEYYDLIGSVQMLGQRRGIKDSPEENPVVLDSYILGVKTEIDEKGAKGAITISVNTGADAYDQFNVGDTFTHSEFSGVIGDDYLAEVWMWTYDPKLEGKGGFQATVRDLELLDKSLTEIKKTIRGQSYTPPPDDNICIEPMALAELLYYNRNGRNNDKIGSYSYVVINPEKNQEGLC